MLSLQVYGDPLEHPQQEQYWGNVNCIGERSCYDEGKRAAECLTFDYLREHHQEARNMTCASQDLLGAWHNLCTIFIMLWNCKKYSAHFEIYRRVPLQSSDLIIFDSCDYDATCDGCWEMIGHLKSPGCLFQVRVVRIFNTYGPRMALDDGRVVSNFLTQALTGKPLTIYGDGQQTRSFQYISDLVSGWVLLWRKSLKTDLMCMKLSSEAMNLSLCKLRL